MSAFSVDTKILNSAPFIDASEGFSDRSFLLATLHAVRMYLFKTLNVKCEFSFSDYVKQQWKIKGMTQYPRAYISMGAIEVQRDRINNRAARTAGVVSSKNLNINDATSNYIKSAKIFPIKISLELHYFESDMDRLLEAVENIAVISALRTFTIPITVHDTFEFQANCEIDDSITIPQIEQGNDSDPGSGELTVNLTITSYVGKVEEVARAFDLTASKERSDANINV